MKQLRFWVAALIVWLIFFFNIERVGHVDLGIKYYTYSFVAFMAISTLAIPHLQRLPLWVLLVVPVTLFSAMKIGLDRPTWADFPIVVTELSAAILTGLIARQIVFHLGRIDHAVKEITIMNLGELFPNFTQSQGVMYREMRRARRHQRPLSLLFLKISDEGLTVTFSRALLEIQKTMAQRYVMASVARALNETLHDYDIIAQQDNSFVILLPEVDEQNLGHVVQKVENAVKDKAKVKLEIGTASYPSQAVTFESMVEMAKDSAAAEDESEASVILGVSGGSTRLSSEESYG